MATLDHKTVGIVGVDIVGVNVKILKIVTVNNVS